MDLTKNCIIKFTESVFVGDYPNGKYSHDRTIQGIIINDSYGLKTGQHTFTIEVMNCDDDSICIGDKIRRKGRNVYSRCKILSYPDNHSELAKDKHIRSSTTKNSIKRIREFDNGNYLVFNQN